MNLIRRPFASLLLCVVIPLLIARAAGAQQIDAAFRADIIKLLELTDSGKIGPQVASATATQVLNGLKAAMPQMPPRMVAMAQEVLDEEFAKAFAGSDTLITAMAEIYARNFTHADVRDMLVFYASDLGKKLVKVMPIVARESQEASGEWADRRMPSVLEALQKRFRAEGLIP